MGRERELLERAQSATSLEDFGDFGIDPARLGQQFRFCAERFELASAAAA
jgi:hypothetical protein